MYVQIADDLRRKIALGTYRPGSKIPSNKDLTDLYGVADGTIRAALEELRGEGIVETRSTLGTFVTAEPPADGSRLDLKMAGERIAELEREVSDLRARMARMEALIAGRPAHPSGGDRDGAEDGR